MKARQTKGWAVWMRTKRGGWFVSGTFANSKTEAIQQFNYRESVESWCDRQKSNWPYQWRNRVMVNGKPFIEAIRVTMSAVSNTRGVRV